MLPTTGGVLLIEDIVKVFWAIRIYIYMFSNIDIHQAYTPHERMVDLGWRHGQEHRWQWFYGREFPTTYSSHNPFSRIPSFSGFPTAKYFQGEIYI